MRVRAEHPIERPATVECTEKSDPDVLTVQSTEDRVRYEVADALNGA